MTGTTTAISQTVTMKIHWLTRVTADVVIHSKLVIA
jgi:hypothetical protein